MGTKAVTTAPRRSVPARRVDEEMGRIGEVIISQPRLIGAVLKELGRQGVGDINHRQLNAIIRGIDDMIAELESPTRIAKTGEGLEAWLASDDTGASSKYMAKTIFGRYDTGRGVAVPHDPDDFGRCVRMLVATGADRSRVEMMKEPKHGPIWNEIAERWDELKAMYDEDFPTGKSTKLYASLTEIHKRHGERKS